jgi:hypothetical protein
MLRRLVTHGQRDFFAGGSQLWVMRPDGRDARRIPNAVVDAI